LAAATAEDLQAMAGRPGVSLAPDRAGTGTNAWWRHPPDVIAVAFGPSSRSAHEEAARAAGVAFSTIDTPRLAADVDTPEALATVWHLGPGPSTRRALEEMGIPERLRPAG
ncbi:MAG: 2-phospho-L-lactate guanylyltransferase, partial [Actinomycetota bacterium]